MGGLTQFLTQVVSGPRVTGCRAQTATVSRLLCIPENLVRYDSPTWAGFSLSADWGQDTAIGISTAATVASGMASS